MNEVWLLLGSNLGDRIRNLQESVELINEKAGAVLQLSSVYETKAWGLKDQPDFLNMVIRIETSLLPEKLLTQIQEIENEIGRIKNVKWGPREIDIDILYFEDLVFNSEELKIPHPGIPNRRFTLVPLLELSPKLIHPKLNLNTDEMLLRSTDESEVNLLIHRNDFKDLQLQQDDGSF